jgi:aryl-alcohol dehydrogenase-like predicted oxidoreductase
MPVSASIEGTGRFARQAIDGGMPAGAYRPLGRTGLVTSTLGFGTYRVDARVSEHAAALDRALSAGINLIDTSTNYMDGLSEACIGNVLAGRRRDEIIVVSKVGYVQGRALALSEDRERRGEAFPEMVKYADGCWHCIHPGFIADQLGRSLERLNLEKVDVYLLHNPEYFFPDALRRRGDVPLKDLRDEFYDRIRRAFAHLEEEVRRGRIGCYGVSSNNFVVSEDDPEATSLERMWTIAGDVASDHHFSVAQLPANLFESGAMLTPNCGAWTMTPLQFAREHDLAILVNRPLNAIYGGRMIRLADTPMRIPEIHAHLDPFLPPAYRDESLSRKALGVLVNTKGVTCVLNGMRRREYVDDSLGAMRGPEFDVGPDLYEAFTPGGDG